MQYWLFEHTKGGYAIGTISRVDNQNWGIISIIRPFTGTNEFCRNYYCEGRTFQGYLNTNSEASSSKLITLEANPEYFL